MRRRPTEDWPHAWQALIAELRGAAGRICLIAGSTSAADSLLERLEADAGLSAARVGGLLGNLSQPPSSEELQSLLVPHQLLCDLDVLFWPALGVQVMPLLRSLARRGPRVSVWPGPIEGGHAIYSRTGRPDYHDVILSDTIVLRPALRRYPDEVPYEAERIGF